MRLGENHRALFHAVAGEFFDHVIRRGRLLEHADVASDDLCFAEAGEQVVRVQHIRRADEPVAEMRAGLDFVTEPAQFLDAPPDRRARDTQFPGEVRARNAGGIFAQRGKNFCVRGHEFLTTNGHEGTRMGTELYANFESQFFVFIGVHWWFKS